MEKKKILIIVDCQNDFITGSLKNEYAIKTVPNIVKKINEFNGDLILVTMDTHGEDYLKTNEGINLPVEHCIKGTNGWELNKDVKKAIGRAEGRNKGNRVVFFEKPTFGSVSLSEFLNNDEICENSELDIEIIGFCTDICVISNALLVKATVYDRANIIVDASCCAGVTNEKHMAALETMKSCQINVI